MNLDIIKFFKVKIRRILMNVLCHCTIEWQFSDLSTKSIKLVLFLATLHYYYLLVFNIKWFAFFINFVLFKISLDYFSTDLRVSLKEH